MTKRTIAIGLLAVLGACAGAHLNSREKVKAALYDVDQENYRRDYLAAHSRSLTPQLRWAIEHSELRNGMTMEEARASRGIPLAEKKSGNVTQWLYFQNLCVFRDGILFFFQD